MTYTFSSPSMVLVRETMPTATLADRIINACASAWGVLPSDIRGTSRLVTTTTARTAAMVLYRESGRSLHEVGDEFDRNHTAVCWAAKTHARRMQSPAYAAKIARIKQALNLQ